MTAQQAIAFAVLAGALALFAWGRLRHDLVAILALLAVVLTGLLPAGAAFDGFGHPAVITVAAVLVISQALKGAGLVDLVAARLDRFTEGPTAHVSSLSGVVTADSAFMNNVGALALMLPVALQTAARRERSPAVLLMPLAFGSILGGMTTLIGTPPNVLIATYRETELGAGFGFFDFAWVGFPVAVIGLVFMATVGWRLVPAARRAGNTTEQLFQVEDYVTELKVLEGSDLIDTTLESVESLASDDVDLIGLARGRGRLMEHSGDYVLREGDILVVQASTKRAQELVDAHGLEILTSAKESFYEMTGEDMDLVEGLVSPASRLVGRNLRYLRRRTGGALSIVALARQGVRVEKRLMRQTFRAGDVLLMQGRREELPGLMATLKLLPLAPSATPLGRQRRVGLSLAIFGAAITAGVMGLTSLPVAFVAAVVAFVLTGVLSVREIYDEIDWPVIVLLAAMIPVGKALEETGATTLVAEQLAGLTSGLPLALTLTLLLVVTMFLSDVINNAATVLVMAPIGVELASRLGASPDPFLMSVAVGASCAFLTPIGHQSNTLVMGPGGYRFGDYWRVGLPLEVIIVVVAVPLILWAWPA
ncbi:MAG: SLC13 family permease [Acidobacteriota bacterium]